MNVPLIVNDKPASVLGDANSPLFWTLREQLALTGTKYVSGIAQCGACTVHLDGKPVRSCVISVSACVGKKITTIDGFRTPDDPRYVKLAWTEIDVPQLGYYQCRQIMSAVESMP